MEKEWKERTGISVWMYTNRHVNKLKRYGFIHYVSKKMNYAIVYVDLENKEEFIQKISQLHFVKKVEESHFKEISMNFQEALEEYAATIQQEQVDER